MAALTFPQAVEQHAPFYDLRERFSETEMEEVEKVANIYKNSFEEDNSAVGLLKQLVNLKWHKDNMGKDEFYYTNQPIIWQKVKDYLEKLKNENGPVNTETPSAPDKIL